MSNTNVAAQMSWRLPTMKNDCSFYRQWSVGAASDEGRQGDSVVLSSHAVDTLSSQPVSVASYRKGHVRPDGYCDYVYG